MKKTKYALLIVLSAVVFIGTVFVIRLPKEKDVDEVSQQATEQSSAKEQENVILTYATLNLDQQMREWIYKFNQTHENCRIEVKEYALEDYQTALMRLNADMVSESSPDLIDLSDIDAAPYITKGAFVNLTPFFESSPETKKEDFISNILHLYGEDGKIYGVTTGFRIETLMGKKSVFPDISQWTIKTMKETIVEMKPEAAIIDCLGPTSLLRIALQIGMEEYVDWENKTCSFESDEFLQLLELADTMDGKVVDGDVEQNLYAGTLLLNRAYISDIRDYKAAVDMFHGEAVVCVGFPSENGGKSLVYPYLPIAISEKCANKQQAWEFVSSLLGEEFQEKYVKFNFPIRISSLEKNFESAMTLREGWGDKAEDLPTREQADSLYEVLGSSYGSCQFDKTIWNIIEEESLFFFSKEKTAAEVAAIIQNRVEMYLYEN